MGATARMARKYRSTMRAATAIIPAPHDIPTAAATQIALAVVRPRTLSCSKKITPAPMKPIPETTCAAIRDASHRILPVSVAGAPYSDTRVNKQLPSPTRMWVLMPASLWCTSRSSPMRPQKSTTKRAGTTS